MSTTTMTTDEAINRLATMTDQLTALQRQLAEQLASKPDDPNRATVHTAVVQAHTALAQAKTQLHVAVCYLDLPADLALSRLDRLDGQR